MNALVVAADVVSMVAFFVAAVLALTFKTESPLITKPVRYAFAAVMVLYGFVGISNVLEHANITAYFDHYEDFAEILFTPGLAFVVGTMAQNQQLEEQRKNARMMRRQSDLLLNIVDTVPGGIMVLDPTGGVTFANEGAERLLSMQSDSFGSVRITPSWTLLDLADGSPTSLAAIASDGPLVRKPFRVRWPDGSSLDIVMSCTPMSGRGGELGGSVVAFEPKGDRD